MNGVGPADRTGPRKLAVLCFLPELGHLTPLLRIAREAKAAGFEVRAFVVDEARGMVERFGLPAEFLGPVTPPGTEGLMGELVAAAGTLRHAPAARRFENEYWVPLILSLADRLPECRELVADFGPDLALEDSHVIEWIYRDVAPKVPHVVHIASGSQFACQRPGVLEEGFWRRARARWTDRRFKAVYTGHLRLGRVFRRRGWVNDQVLRGRLEEKEALAAARTLPVPERRISTGMGVLEGELLGSRIRQCDGVEFYGSLDPRAGTSLDDGLVNWLGSSDRPVAYVSFGSMIPSDTGLGKSVRRGLERAGARILWVSGREKGRKGGGPSGSHSTDFRREAFLPQADVLAHPAIKVFVTHAGSGGVQDGVWNGKPLLCIPMVSDQPYNARVVEALGSGISVPAREASASAIERAARRLLGDDSIREGARELSRRMKNQDGGRKVVELLREVADTS